MTVYVIPLVATPSQTLSVQLGAQSCRIDVRQRRIGMFVDLFIQDVPIVLGVKALDRINLVRGGYLGFTGSLFMADTQGNDPPSYEGLGGRWLLCWDDAI